MSEVQKHGNKSKNNAPQPISNMPDDHRVGYHFSSEHIFSLEDNSCRRITSATTYVVEQELQTQNLSVAPQIGPQHTQICEFALNMHIIRVEGLQDEYNRDYDGDISNCSSPSGKSIPFTGAEHYTKLYSAASSAKDLAALANGDTSSSQDLVDLSTEARMASCAAKLEPVHHASTAFDIQVYELQVTEAHMARVPQFMQPYLPGPDPSPLSAIRRKKSDADAVKYCCVGRPNPKRLRHPLDDLAQELCSKHRRESSFDEWMVIHKDDPDAWRCA